VLLGRARCCVVSVNLLEPDGFHNRSRPLGGCGKYLRRRVRHLPPNVRFHTDGMDRRAAGHTNEPPLMRNVRAADRAGDLDRFGHDDPSTKAPTVTARNRRRGASSVHAN
jgi:hypothetical protein